MTSALLTPQLHNQVFQALSEAVIVTDLSGRVVDCNRAAEEMLGMGRASMLGLDHVALRDAGNPPGRPSRVHGARIPAPVPETVILQALTEQGSWSGDVPLPG